MILVKKLCYFIKATLGNMLLATLLLIVYMESGHVARDRLQVAQNRTPLYSWQHVA